LSPQPPGYCRGGSPINFVAIIRRKNENIEFALTLFCEKDIMSQTVETQRSWNSPAATGPDVAQWLDLYFPRVDELLHRLAETQTAQQTRGAHAAVWIVEDGGGLRGLLHLRAGIRHSGRDPAGQRQCGRPADRSPDGCPSGKGRPFAADRNGYPRKLFQRRELFRRKPKFATTTIWSSSPRFVAPRRYRARRATCGPAGDNQAKAPAQRPRGLCQDAAETLEPAPRAPSLLENLFSVFVPQFSQPPSQRQM